MGRVRALVAQREAGMSTAEYAIGICGAGGFAGLLYKLLTGGFGQQLLESVFKKVLSLVGLG